MLPRDPIHMEFSQGRLALCRQVGPRVVGPRSETVLRSRATDRTDAVGSNHDRKTTEERILRYPNGDTRMIRYPVPEVEEDQDPDSAPSDMFGLLGETSFSGGILPAGESKLTELPSSPAELIQFLNSDEYREAQKQLQKQIRGSYEVHEASPWIVSRALFVIAVQNEEDANPLTYTLPTRVERSKTAMELAQVLNKKNIFNVGEVLDGVIAFEDSDEAERFRASLEAEGYAEANLFEVDSHELFRNTHESRAVVVLMNCQDYFPFSLELGTSLREHTSLEADLDNQ